MANVLVLYHSMYGHIETMARAVAEGARNVAGANVLIERVPETMDPAMFAAAGGKAEQVAPVATPGELADYDAILGVPTRFGNMCGQMRTFLDQTGGLWAKGALVGKVASVSTSTGTGGGQEMTITSTWTTLAHHGMLIVPIGYTNPGAIRRVLCEERHALRRQHHRRARWFAPAPGRPAHPGPPPSRSAGQAGHQALWLIARLPAIGKRLARCPCGSPRQSKI